MSAAIGPIILLCLVAVAVIGAPTVCFINGRVREGVIGLSGVLVFVIATVVGGAVAAIRNVESTFAPWYVVFGSVIGASIGIPMLRISFRAAREALGIPTIRSLLTITSNPTIPEPETRDDTAINGYSQRPAPPSPSELISCVACGTRYNAATLPECPRCHSA